MQKAHVSAAASPDDYRIGQAEDRSASGPPDPAESDFGAVEECLRLLARALRQYRTYPPTSPLCTEAIASCHKALTSLPNRDRLEVRVTPSELVVDENPLGAGTVIEHELAHRLHRARVLTLEIDRAVTVRHLSRFCSDLLRCDTHAVDAPTLVELLTEHGVDTIIPQIAYRPEVLDVGAPVSTRCELVEHEQRRRTQAITVGAVEYLYPRDKGWVRLDPTARLETVSLTDLAVLVDDPTEIATALLRLTDDPLTAETGATALERKFSDVTGLFNALDPALARIMFAKLANAVLALEPDRRRNLLQRTVLPGLLDGHADGTILRDFPDDDLADALCLLLELDTAAPEVLTAAITRLELPAERRDAVLPLIDRRLQHQADESGHESDGERGLDRLARRLVRVEAAPGKDFSEFSAFDLSIDESAVQSIADLRARMDATDVPAARLECLLSLVRMQPSAKVVDALMRRVAPPLAEFFDAGQWESVVSWIERFRTLASELQEERPDAADCVMATLAALLHPRRVTALMRLYKDDAKGRDVAGSVVAAFGTAAASALAPLLDRANAEGQAVVSLMCEHAGVMAPVLAPELAEAGPTKRRAIIKILGFAGPGFETAIASQFELDDEQIAREATRALARIGSGPAAAIVARQVQNGSPRVLAAAEESLWHFPPSRVSWQLRQLLGSSEFVAQHPKIAARLLERAVQTGTRGLDEVLVGLERFRFRFWNPGLIRVALKARELKTR